MAQTYDYFISYRRACGGALSARLVKSILCKCGKTAFLDVDDITAGEFKPQIVDAIENSKDFILILNEDSWREKKEIDVYYKEIIKITEQSGDIIPIEFAKGVLNNVPEFLQGQLKRIIKDFQKISYNNEPLSDFENNICKTLRIQYTTDTQSDVKQFSMSIPLVELINRDQMVKKLSDEIVKHRLLNLIGIGGSGKTSLTYLMARTYGRQFNNIAHVAVNGNIKEDFVDSIDNTLEICQKEDTINKKYDKIFAELKKNYSVGNNLLILDINEIPDKNALNDFVNELGELPNSWIFLILSREKIGEYEYLNINDDAIFLKDLFLKKTENRYKDFEDFDKLWDVVYYNPLLTEQLGIYLRNLPKTKTLEEIENILYGEKFRGKQREGINKLKRGEKDDKTIIYFLKNLIHYQDFTPDEQELLRHFVLWKSEYIQYDVIEDLLQGVCKDLEETLGSLAKRSIFDYDQKGKTAYYKLHGLLADSLREQIFKTKQDYATYFDNIKIIRDYNFRDFLPYADCIGNSLCNKYEITTNVPFLNNWANKFHITWKTDYAQKLYDKCIEISNQRLKNESENIDYLEDLSYANNNLATLLEYQLNDYESAETHYNNAIEIDKRIIKISDTPKYLNLLATHYNNLANLQQAHQNNLKYAETNYNKAIEIHEKITKISYNVEYLYGLSRAYYNLAYLQQNRLNDYNSAEKHYKKVIKIGEEIRRNSNEPECLNLLAKAYNNLASMQFNQKKYESAFDNCTEAIEIINNIKDINLKYLIDWIIAKDILANLYIAISNPTEAQKNVDDIKPLAEELFEEYPQVCDLQKVNEWIKNTESVLNKFFPS